MTVEITKAQHRNLARLAAARGERDVSRLVQKAIDLYLRMEVRRSARVKAGLSVLGTLDDREAEALLQATRSLRQAYPTPRGSCGRS